ncbi:MAG: tRNA (N6-isopentenyl adenosine(37)-C2)-methylthiotransferase MiaB [Patescibacteria group bacterium]
MKKINNKIFHIITIGCQMNIADSERLAAFLESRGFREAEDFKRAGVAIINTCGVRQAAENRADALVFRIRQVNPRAKIIIIGCLSRRPDVKERLAGQVDLFLPTSEMTRLSDLLAEIGARDDGAKSLSFAPIFSRDERRLEQGEKYLKIKPKYKNNFSAYIPIGNGCNNFCSYCVVPYARGREVYRSAGEIIKEARRLIKAGYKEIILIAQNVNSYKDSKSAIDFPELLSSVASLPGKFWVRFASSHPKDLSDKLIKIIGKSPKICPHLHLAVQSGDDQILKAMNRKYTAAAYRKLIKKIRAVRPGIAITTDVIVGFPGETKARFENTLKLFKAIKFDLAYIARYSPRPGTAAAKLKDNVNIAEKKRRAYVLNEILKETALSNNKKYLGRTLEVLVEGRNRQGKLYGKAGGYQTVLIEEANHKSGAVSNKTDSASKTSGPSKLIGKFVMVKIIRARAFGLEGETVG